MAHDLDAALRDFKADDYSVRLVGGVTGLLPFTEPLPAPGPLLTVARKAAPDHAERIARRVRELSAEPAAQSALGTANLLDTGDKGIALFSGVRGVVHAVKGTGEALETDPQQLADAALKGLGISWIAWRLFDGSPTERADALWHSPAGRALVVTYAAVDLALPFTDNLLTGGAGFINDLIDKAAVDSGPRLAAVGDVGRATELFQSLRGRLTEVSTTAAQSVQPLTKMAQDRLPPIAAGADKIAGVVATAADALSLYRYLVAALVLEQCLGTAMAELNTELAEAEAKRIADARAAAEAAEARKAASGVKTAYKLDEGLAAANLENNPIQYTRTGGDPEPEKSGCGCCGGAVVLLAIGLAGAVAQTAMAAF